MFLSIAYIPLIPNWNLPHFPNTGQFTHCSLLALLHLGSICLRKEICWETHRHHSSLPVLSSMLSSETCSFWCTHSPLHLKKICMAGTALQRNTIGLLLMMYASSGSCIKWGSVPGADGIDSGRASLLSFPKNTKKKKKEHVTWWGFPTNPRWM